MKKHIIIASLFLSTSLFSHEATGTSSLNSVEACTTYSWKSIAIGTALTALAVFGILYVEADQGRSTSESSSESH